MKTRNETETRELLLGTWIAIALLIEMLVDREIVLREDMMLLFGDAEAMSCDARRLAFAGLRLLVERGFH